MILTTLVRQYIAANPTELIARLDFEQQAVWLKRRPESKKNIWHSLLHYLTYVVPLPILYPTVITNGRQSLHNESRRLRLFATRNIPVPLVIDVQDDYLITADVGKSIQRHLEQSITIEDKSQLLGKALAALGALHQAGLCHGRPSLDDMTYLDEVVFFIDLEEDPLQVMSLAQAQARDLWLFFYSVAKHCQNQPELLDELFTYYHDYADTETIAALKQLVLFLRPLRIAVEYSFLFAINSRDLRCGVLANKALEQHFINAKSVKGRN